MNERIAAVLAVKEHYPNLIVRSTDDGAVVTAYGEVVYEHGQFEECWIPEPQNPYWQRWAAERTE